MSRFFLFWVEGAVLVELWDAKNDIMETPTHTLSLLEDMMPEWEIAKKMLPSKKE